MMAAYYLTPTPCQKKRAANLWAYKRTSCYSDLISPVTHNCKEKYFGFALLNNWSQKKMRSPLRPIKCKWLNQSWLGHPRFPALWTVCLFFSLAEYVIFSSLIGCWDCYGFGFLTIDRKALYYLSFKRKSATGKSTSTFIASENRGKDER